MEFYATPKEYFKINALYGYYQILTCSFLFHLTAIQRGRQFMRQRLRNLTPSLRWQTSQHVLQINVRIMPIHARGLTRDNL